MLRNLVLVMTGVTCLAPMVAHADEFEALTGKRLVEILSQPDVSDHTQLTLADLADLPFAVPGVRSAFLIVKTDAGNVAKLVVSPGQRKPLNPKDEPAPIFVLERFETFDGGNLGTRLAKGKDLILFAGFQVDLDTGVVVPEGQGGDLIFQTEGKLGARIVPHQGAAIVTLAKPIAIKFVDKTKLSTSRTVTANDFAGRYRLFADGQWSGLLHLEVNESIVSGTFQSDLNGTSYPVQGEVSAALPHQLKFVISYPRAKQEFASTLFTDGKGAMVGTGTLLSRSFGFFATREGGRIAPADVEITDLLESKTIDVIVTKTGDSLGGKPFEIKLLVEEIEQLSASPTSVVVRLKVGEDVAFARVHQLLNELRGNGIGTIRLGPID